MRRRNDTGEQKRAPQPEFFFFYCLEKDEWPTVKCLKESDKRAPPTPPFPSLPSLALHNSILRRTILSGTKYGGVLISEACIERTSPAPPHPPRLTTTAMNVNEYTPHHLPLPGCAPGASNINLVGVKA